MRRRARALLLLLSLAGCGRSKVEALRCFDAAQPWCLVTTSPGMQRAQHHAVWSGQEVLIWGGGERLADREALSSGLRVNPRTGRVRPMSTVGAPSLRHFPFVAWTGRELLVWGGRNAVLNQDSPGDGALYDPETDSWRPIEVSGRHRAAAVGWTGAELFVWGGRDQEQLHSGFLFDPETGIERRVNPEGAPIVNDHVNVVRVGDVLVVPDQQTDTITDPYRPLIYDLQADEWRGIDPAGAIRVTGTTPAFAHFDRAYFCEKFAGCAVYWATTDAWLSFQISADRAGQGSAWAHSSQGLVLVSGSGLKVRDPVHKGGILDLDAEYWRDLPQQGQPSPRNGASLTQIDDTTFFLWGGEIVGGGVEAKQEGYLLRLD